MHEEVRQADFSKTSNYEHKTEAGEKNVEDQM